MARPTAARRHPHGGPMSIRETPLAVATITAYCRSRGWPEPEREWEFHAFRKWRFDLCWPAAMIAVELNGGVHTKGRHVRGIGYEADRDKCNEAQLLGWLVLEVTYRQVEMGKLFDWLDRAFRLRGDGRIDE
jgi:hypothetical protein